MLLLRSLRSSLAPWALLAAGLSAQELRRTELGAFLDCCYDPHRQRVLAVGYAGYTSEWDGAVWRRAPDVGARPGFLWCNATGHILQLRPAYSAMPAEVARRVGMTWQRLPTVSAFVYQDAQLVHDPLHDVVIAFGGRYFSSYSGATSTFDGTTWTSHASASAPAPRAGGSLAYDELRQRAVLFGGRNASTTFADTWEWDGSTWTERVLAVHPSARTGAAIAYDRARQVVMLVGGEAPGGGALSDHWEYDGTQWTARPALPAAMAGQTGTRLVHDAARGETLLLGGLDTIGATGLVHAFDGTTWHPRPGFGRSPRYGHSAFAADAAGVLRFGGGASYPPTQELWRWNGATWSLVSVGGPSPRSGAMMWHQQGDTYVFGGTDANGYCADVWRWNGAWSPAPAGPPARTGAGVAFDAANQRLVLYGGLVQQGVAVDDTWLFDGVTWQSVTTLPRPPARAGMGMAFDPTRNRVVVTGGRYWPTPVTPVPRYDTWEWDGTTWQQVSGGPALFPYGTAAFDAHLGKVVYAAPERADNISLSAWDGVAWTPLMVPGTFGSTTPLVAGADMVTAPNGRATIVDLYGVAELILAPARTTAYGTDCSPAAPRLAAAALPIVGDATFALDVTQLPANGIAVLGAGDAAAAVPLLGCTLLVANVVTLGAVASATGHAPFPVPLPAQPALVGVPFFFQAATLSPLAPAGLALSAGLRVDLGQ